MNVKNLSQSSKYAERVLTEWERSMSIYDLKPGRYFLHKEDISLVPTDLILGFEVVFFFLEVMIASY